MFSCCTRSAVSKFKPHFAMKTRVIPDKAKSSNRTRGIVFILRVNREHCHMCPSPATLHNYLQVQEFSNVVTYRCLSISLQIDPTLCAIRESIVRSLLATQLSESTELSCWYRLPFKLYRNRILANWATH